MAWNVLLSGDLVSPNRVISPGAGTLSVAGAVSAILAPRTISPGAASLAFSGSSPLLSGASSGAPVLLYTDIVSGSPVNGENGKGAYLSLYGLNFGTAANLGTVLGAKVYIGNQEIDNYRGLWATAVSGGIYNSVVSAAKPGFPLLQHICVQIGSAGVKALTYGTAYDVSVVVNGQASNATDVLGNRLQFTPNPGHFYFCSLTGNDATGVVDDPTHPFRYVQNFGGGTSGATTGVFLTLNPGDTVVQRAGTWQDQVGYEGRFMRFSNRNTTGGTAPTGVGGTGYIHFTSYPGEDVYFLNPSGGIGGYMGAGTAYVRPNGSAGQYWSCSNIRADASGTCGSSDAAPFNLQNSADHTRFVNLDVQWNTTSTNMLAGGIVGNGDPMVIAVCRSHNVHGSPTNKENHNIYVDGSNTCAHNVEIGFCIMDTADGQNIQLHNQVATDQFHDVNIHHCWAENSGKYNLKLDSAGANIRWWNIVANYSVREGFQFDSTGSSASPSVYLENITFVDNYHDTAGYLSVIANEGANLAGGSFSVNNCILAQLAGRTNSGISWFGGQTGITRNGNLYYDYAGILISKDSADTAGIYADPKLQSAVGYPNTDARLQAGSNALNRALAATIDPTNDLGMNAQPRSGDATASVGAFA